MALLLAYWVASLLYLNMGRMQNAFYMDIGGETAGLLGLSVFLVIALLGVYCASIVASTGFFIFTKTQNDFDTYKRKLRSHKFMSKLAIIRWELKKR